MKTLFAMVFAIILFAEPSFAQTSGAAPEIGGVANFFPLVIIMVLAYFFIFRPQIKQQRAHEESVTAIKRNEKVILTSGIEGVVTKVDDANKRLTVRIAEGVEIKVVHDGGSVRTVVDRKPANDDTKKKGGAKTSGSKKTETKKSPAKKTAAAAKKKPATKKKTAK